MSNKSQEISVTIKESTSENIKMLTKNGLQDANSSMHMQVKEAKYFLASIVDSSQDSVVTINFDTIITSWNKAAETIYGYSASEAVGKPLTMLTLPEDLQEILKNIDKIKRSRKVETFKTIRKQKDGNDIKLEVVMSPVKDEIGRVIGVSTIARDVTEPRRLEEELKSRLRQQEAIVKLGQQALSGMSLHDLMNEATATIVKILNCDLSKILELLPNKKEFLFRAGVGWKRGIIGHQVMSAAKDNLGGYTLHLRKPVIFYDLNTEKRFKSPKIHFDHGVTSGFHVVILGRKGEYPYGILGACSKTTRVFTHDDTHFLQAVANILSEGIERKKIETRKDEFLSIISHELKTPITSIKVYSQILGKRLKESEDGKNAYFVTKINGQTDKISHLISDLLDIGKIESGKLVYSKKKFKIDAILQKIVIDFQYTTESHEIKKIGSTKSTIVGDPDRIGQVLINLLTNAIKYSPQGMEIIVSSNISKGNVVVSVQDFGIGIPKSKQQHVFDKYFQVNEKGDQGNKGFGLGLYITYEIVKRHKGEMWMESSRGKGSTFYFSLPIQKKT